MSPGKALWLWSNRRNLLKLALFMAGTVSGCTAVVTSAFVTTPMVTDEIIDKYVAAAERLGVNGAKWQELMAVDAVRFRQDFSKVTDTTINETAWLFAACSTKTRHEAFEHTLSRRGESVTQMIHLAKPGRITWTLESAGPPPTAELLDSLDRPVGEGDLSAGVYYLRVTATQEQTTFRLVVEVETDGLTCQSRPIEDVMAQLGFPPEDRELAISLLQAFASEPDTDFQPNEEHLAWPVTAFQISSLYGPRIHPVTGQPGFHAGVDIPAHEGTPVYAVKAGRVISAGQEVDLGLTVRVDHGDLVSVYGHLSQITVTVGQAVGREEVLGRVGNTGISTGPHLHFELLGEGKPRDPLDRYR